MSFEVAVAERADLDLMVAWAAAEGWNPGLGDAEAFLAADPRGFLIARVDGEPAACVSVVRYGERFAFLGFYICRPDLRGRGHGFALWRTAIDRMGARTIGLDGVVAQQANYRRSGFALAHRNVRYGGRVAAAAQPGAPIVRIEGDLIEAAVDVDRRHFPAPREDFARAWFSGGGRRLALGWLEEGRLAGVGVVRPCRSGYKIGPLYADDERVAEGLFAALAAEAGGAELFLDLPVPNGTAARMAERAGMTPVFETARMYRGEAPHLPLARIYGITSFELG